MDNSTDKNRLMLDNQIKSPVSGARMATLSLCASNLTNIVLTNKLNWLPLNDSGVLRAFPQFRW